MRKAAEPMIGGMIWPPVDATLSMAAACSGRNPVLFIVGMVALPVSTTFATAAPVTVPTNPEPITAGNARAAPHEVADVLAELQEQGGARRYGGTAIRRSRTGR